MMTSSLANLGTAWRKLARRSFAGPMRLALKKTPQPAPTAEPPLHPSAPHPFDLRHGTDTSGLIDGAALRSGHPNDPFNTAYYGMSPSRFRWIMDSWAADPSHASLEQYTFVDLGCGKGRALMLAAEYRFRRALGVELHPGLTAIAQRNLALWNAADRSRCPTKVICQDATEFLLPEGPCLLYLFNPFTAPLVKRLIERLATQFSARPGMLDLLYFNPQSADLLDAHPGFELLWTGTVPMSEEDTAADAIASPEDLCSVYRWLGTTAL